MKGNTFLFNEEKFNPNVIFSSDELRFPPVPINKPSYLTFMIKNKDSQSISYELKFKEDYDKSFTLYPNNGIIHPHQFQIVSC